jgi:hypothetical protein
MAAVDMNHFASHSSQKIHKLRLELRSALGTIAFSQLFAGLALHSFDDGQGVVLKYAIWRPLISLT